MDTGWKAEDGPNSGRSSPPERSQLAAFYQKRSPEAGIGISRAVPAGQRQNQLAGKVVSVRIDGLLAEVILSFGDARITAIITANAVRELNLKKGETAAALIKSTDVMIERLDEEA